MSFSIGWLSKMESLEQQIEVFSIGFCNQFVITDDICNLEFVITDDICNLEFVFTDDICNLEFVRRHL
jgi:hypothetical protein